jgi:SAM-dependent MidA family methyltransferase
MGVGQIILQEISTHAQIPFSRFMELALYCPEYGFYEKEADSVGRGGDFYTSVSVGSLFGQLLAFDFADKLSRLKKRYPESGIQLIEAGAHDGKLARDILTWMNLHRAQLFERLEYLIIEPSRRRRQWQETTLAGFGGKVRWADRPSDPPSSILHPQCSGILFANELLDAFPVRRVGWDAGEGKWFEWGVDVQDERFVWARLSLAHGNAAEVARVLDCPADLLAVLPDGFTTEISPAATAWWADAARAVASGHLMTLDYGLSGEEFFQPQRKDGTLRSYHRHQLVPDVLAQPGEQDITSHVNFTAIRAAGESAGLRTEFFGTQSQFLTGIAGEAWTQNGGFGEWQVPQTRQFQTLTHPDFLGRAFRALVQSR